MATGRNFDGLRVDLTARNEKINIEARERGLMRDTGMCHKNKGR